MREYSLSTELQWSMWNERLNKLDNNIRELRLVSCAVTIIILILATLLKTSNFYMVILLAFSGILWGMTFIYSVLYIGKGLISFDYRDIENDLHDEEFYILMKELEYSYYSSSRQLNILKKLSAVSMIYTMSGIFAFLYGVIA